MPKNVPVSAIVCNKRYEKPFLLLNIVNKYVTFKMVPKILTLGLKISNYFVNALQLWGVPCCALKDHSKTLSGGATLSPHQRAGVPSIPRLWQIKVFCPQLFSTLTEYHSLTEYYSEFWVTVPPHKMCHGRPPSICSEYLYGSHLIWRGWRATVGHPLSAHRLDLD